MDIGERVEVAPLLVGVFFSTSEGRGRAADQEGVPRGRPPPPPGQAGWLLRGGEGVLGQRCPAGERQPTVLFCVTLIFFMHNIYLCITFCNYVMTTYIITMYDFIYG